MKIEGLFNKYYNLFTANDKYICECILNHKEDCIKFSIDEFADKYHISTSALSRFAQKLQLPGYSELRVIIRLNETEVEYKNQSKHQLMDCYNKVIDDIEKKDCSIMFERMKKANRIIVFGEGYSQERVAKEMKRIFLPTGKIIYDVYGYDMIQALNHFIKTDDMIFFISLNGDASTIIDFAKKMKMKGIYMVSITKMISNPLARLCDENLYIQSISISVDKQLDYDVTTPYFILIELLYIKYKMYLESEHIPRK
ncbi:TPA: MurR/RpiR family transcriptional regulator [Clostridioides difficile]|uniref:MurR/RpiR family transcriptional regulator n=1 Tax=Clostridioides difficile TaxID=1496 RepID=UPI00097FF7AC|nr:MurR/RpiR family transcriptional regulator [Clostridioides difficile]EGT4599004.1 MurR/RpiR family transcriptional regulator [Clostridioides difficile]MCJ0055044.1 MurR/RpiR family transcriptional regulator [Clostridioides difficile]MCW0825653.1 MurR/RpiR family transcriptional regulator [Clostridioides difficile]MDK3180506.1 MurR/RpiR family transcriptional regulator [Clostridioides difficile]MDV9592535.1 MurR/RpiR family transcriptional regulator [Clostridioides difficile]